MAFDLWVAKQNIERYRRLLETMPDADLRATVEDLLRAEEAKIPDLEASRIETLRRLKRWLDRAEELRTVAEQTENDDARAKYIAAVNNYATLARNLAHFLSDVFGEDIQNTG